MRIRIPFGRLILRLLPSRKPVGLDVIRLLRRISVGTDTLSPSDVVRTRGGHLHNRFLADLLAEHEMGVWTLGAATINHLEAAIRSAAPCCALEFGSGLSTVCLARFMADRGGEHRDASTPAVISIDQSGDAVAKTRELLTKSGLEQRVSVFHAPLEPRAVEGRVVNSYVLPEQAVEAIAAARPDFVLIDGPFAEPGARFGTLPLVRPYLRPGARFYLDDGLRDGEIDAALLWTRLLDGVSVEGILPMDKGLLVGCIN